MTTLSDDIVERIIREAGVGLPQKYAVSVDCVAPTTVGIFRGILDDHGDLWALEEEADWNFVRERQEEWSDQNYHSISAEEWNTVFTSHDGLYLPGGDDSDLDSVNDDSDSISADEGGAYTLRIIGECVEKTKSPPVRLLAKRFKNRGAPLRFRYKFCDRTSLDDDCRIRITPLSDEKEVRRLAIP